MIFPKQIVNWKMQISELNVKHDTFKFKNNTLRCICMYIFLDTHRERMKRIHRKVNSIYLCRGAFGKGKIMEVTFAFCSVYSCIDWVVFIIIFHSHILFICLSFTVYLFFTYHPFIYYHALILFINPSNYISIIFWYI